MVGTGLSFGKQSAPSLFADRRNAKLAMLWRHNGLFRWRSELRSRRIRKALAAEDITEEKPSVFDSLYGLIYSQTVSHSGVTSKTHPQWDSVINVLPFGRRCAALF